MKLVDLINSCSTDINIPKLDNKDLILDIMKFAYDDGWNPNYLLVNSKNIKQIKNMFKDYRRRDLGKHCYETDFGILKILQNKKIRPDEILVTDKF